MIEKIYLNKYCFEYILAFMLFLQCNTCYFFLLPDSITKVVELFSVLLLFIISIFGNTNLSRRRTFFFICVFGLFLTPLFYKALLISTHVGFVYRFCLILPMLIFYFGSIDSRRHDYSSLLLKFSTITYLFAVISLIFWLLSEVSGLIGSSGFVSIDWGKTLNYGHNFYLHFHGQGIRNCGVFTEAPMYNIVLCTSLCVELFLKEKVNKLRIIVYIVTILTTMSTTGQLLLLMLFMNFFLNQKLNCSFFIRILIYSLFFVVVSLFFIVGVFIFLEKMEGHSYMVRMSYILKEVMAWYNSPVWGSGYSSYIDGSSNSSTLLLAEGGLWLFVFYVCSFILIPYVKRNEHKGLLKVSICYFFMLCITVVPYTTLTFTIIAMEVARMLHINKINYI